MDLNALLEGQAPLFVAIVFVVWVFGKYIWPTLSGWILRAWDERTKREQRLIDERNEFRGLILEIQEHGEQSRQKQQREYSASLNEQREETRKLFIEFSTSINDGRQGVIATMAKQTQAVEALTEMIKREKVST